MRIAWESQGEGAPRPADAWARLHARGMGPAAELLARRYRVLSFDNRGIGESEIPPGPYTVEQLAGDAVAVLDSAGDRPGARARREPGRVRGAGARGGVARAGRPARARVHLARRSRRVPAPGGDAAADGRGAVAAARGRAAALRRERARAGCARRARGRDLRLPAGASARSRRAGRRRPPPARPGTPTAAATITAPTLVVTGSADQVVDPRNSELLAARIPTRASDRRGCRAHALLGADRGVRSRSWKVSSDEPRDHRPDAARPRPRHAGARGDRLRERAGRTRDLDRRSDEIAVRARAGNAASRRSRRTAPSTSPSSLAARRRGRSCIRSPGGSRRRRSPTSSTTPSPRCLLVQHEFRQLADAALELAAGAAAARASHPTGRRRSPRPRIRCSWSTRRHDRQAEGRARSRRPTASGRTSRSTSRPGSAARRGAAGAAAVPRRRLERAAAARLVEGRAGPARARVRGGPRARADRVRARDRR